MFQHLRSVAHLARHFLASERASVAVSSALVLPVLLGVSGLAIEYGDALVTRAETQRVADLAAHAGAVAYGGGSDTGAMTQAVHNVAALNGVATDEISASIDQGGSAGPVVRVTITTPRPLVLSRIISAEGSLDVTVRSAATLEQGAPACVQALNASGSGITVNGGTSLTATECAVASNASVTASGGARIVTRNLTYDSATAPVITGGASVTAPDGGAARMSRSPTSDPLAGNAALALTEARLALVAGLTGPTLPAIATGPNIDFAYNNSATQNQAVAVGCSASRSGNTWAFTCPSGGTVNLGNLTIGGGLNLDFALSGTAATTFNFSGSIRNTGSVMRFGPGVYTIAGGIVTGGGTTTTFAAGTYRVGRVSTSCDGLSGVSICNTATMSIAGPSVFELVGGVRNTGGGSLTLGTGSGNRFRIGAASNGIAVTLDGGSTTILGDASGSGDRFQIVGNVTTAGGSCFTVGAADNHDIAGRLDMQGGVVLGSGVYAIDGYLHLGASSGGSVTCQGETVSLKALGVTLLLSGDGMPASNQNCNGIAAFCIGSGYSAMQLVSPTTGPFALLAVLGPLASGVTAGASFTGGASGGRISGAFYFPNGPIALSGGASTGGSSDSCLQIIGATVTLTGGTAAASECIFGQAGGAAVVRIVE